MRDRSCRASFLVSLKLDIHVRIKLFFCWSLILLRFFQKQLSDRNSVVLAAVAVAKQFPNSSLKVFAAAPQFTNRSSASEKGKKETKLKP